MCLLPRNAKGGLPRVARGQVFFRPSGAKPRAAGGGAVTRGEGRRPGEAPRRADPGGSFRPTQERPRPGVDQVRCTIGPSTCWHRRPIDAKRCLTLGRKETRLGQMERLWLCLLLLARPGCEACVNHWTGVRLVLAPGPRSLVGARPRRTTRWLGRGTVEPTVESQERRDCGRLRVRSRPCLNPCTVIERSTVREHDTLPTARRTDARPARSTVRLDC